MLLKTLFLCLTFFTASSEKVIELNELYEVSVPAGEGLLVFHSNDCVHFDRNRFAKKCHSGSLWIRGVNILPVSLYYSKRDDERWLHSNKAANFIVINQLKPAQTISELITRIETQPNYCWPDNRDLYFESVEIICFALGYKQVLLRQRIFTVTESSSQISAIAKPLLTPLVAPLLRFLLNHKQVGYVISTNYWGEKEDSFLFYHHGFEKTVETLMDMKVQDATNPGQPTEEERIFFSITSGRMLGYSEESVFEYVKEVYKTNQNVFQRGINRFKRLQKTKGFKLWQLGWDKTDAIVDFKYWGKNEFKPDFETFRNAASLGEFAWNIPAESKPESPDRVEL